MRKAIVTLCTLVGLAMPATANSWFLDISGPPISDDYYYPRRPPHSYFVREGDTLWRIAKRNYGTGNKYPIIAGANKIKSPYRIYPYQELMIPQQ